MKSLLLDLIHGDVADSGVITIDDLGDLLESRTTGLDVHEVDEADLTENPDAVDEVKSPGVTTGERAVVGRGGLPGVEGQRVEVVVQKKSDLHRDVEEHETLGTERVGEDLNGITNQETRPTSRVEDTVEPDEEDHGVIGSRGLVLLVKTTGKSPEDEDDEHTTGGEQEGETTVKAVDEHGASNRDNHIENGLSSGDDETVLLTLETSVLVEDSGVVGDDTVSGPLGEETKREENDETVAVTLGLEEVGVSGGVGGELLSLDGFTDLAVLELNGRVVGIAVGVVLAEDSQGFVMAVLGDEKTGRLGNP